MDQREIYRLQRENDRYRRELSQQASRYEDRITELHGVLAELKRKTAEMQSASGALAVGNGARTGVDELVEVSDSEVDAEEGDDGVMGCQQSDYATPIITPPQPASDATFDNGSQPLVSVPVVLFLFKSITILA